MYFKSLDENTNVILNELSLSLKSIYGEKLKEILLYGSYARKQNDDESDIDIMVLVDTDEVELKKYAKQLNDIIGDIGYRHMKVLSVVDMSHQNFNYWVDVMPYYKNVRNEGIVIYER